MWKATDDNWKTILAVDSPRPQQLTSYNPIFIVLTCGTRTAQNIAQVVEHLPNVGGVMIRPPDAPKEYGCQNPRDMRRTMAGNGDGGGFGVPFPVEQCIVAGVYLYIMAV